MMFDLPGSKNSISVTESWIWGQPGPWHVKVKERLATFIPLSCNSTGFPRVSCTSPILIALPSPNLQLFSSISTAWHLIYILPCPISKLMTTISLGPRIRPFSRKRGVYQIELIPSNSRLPENRCVSSVNFWESLNISETFHPSMVGKAVLDAKSSRGFGAFSGTTYEKWALKTWRACWAELHFGVSNGCPGVAGSAVSLFVKEFVKVRLFDILLVMTYTIHRRSHFLYGDYLNISFI